MPNGDQVNPPKSKRTAVAAHGSALAIVGTAITVGLTSDDRVVQITAIVVAGIVAVAWAALTYSRTP